VSAADRAALLEVFLIEARECLLDMRRALRALESRLDDGGPLEGVYRSVRIIAGNAPSVGLHGAGTLAHAVQGVVRSALARVLPVNEALVATLDRSVDRLRELLA
jgi:chemotaxis protein histidine kinase CheA